MAKRRNKQQPDTTAPAETAASVETDATRAGDAADRTMAICAQIADAPSLAPPGDDVLKAEIAKAMSAPEESAPAVEKIFPLVRAEKVIDARIIDEKVIDEKVIDEKVVN